MTAALHAGRPCEPLSMSDVTFVAPVPVGSMLRLSGGVASTDGRLLRLVLRAEKIELATEMPITFTRTAAMKTETPASSPPPSEHTDVSGVPPADRSSPSPSGGDDHAAAQVDAPPRRSVSCQGAAVAESAAGAASHSAARSTSQQGGGGRLQVMNTFSFTFNIPPCSSS